MCPKRAQSVTSSGESVYKSVSSTPNFCSGSAWVVCKKQLEQEPKLQHAVSNRKNGGDAATASVPYYLKPKL